MNAWSRCGLISLAVALAAASDARSQSPPRTSAPSSFEVLEKHVDQQLRAWNGIDAFAGSVDALRTRLTVSGTESPQTLDAIRRLALSLSLLGDHELAHAMWSIYEFVVSGIDPCSPRVAEAILERGRAARFLTVPPDLNRMYADALSILDSSDPEQLPLVARLKYFQGHLWRQPDIERSIGLFREAIGLYEQTYSSDPLEIAGARVWMAWTLFHTGRYRETEENLVLARREMEALGFPDHQRLGVVEGLLGDLRAMGGDWEDAESHYVRAVHLFERAGRINSTRFNETAIDAHNLAAAQLMQGKGKAAWESLQYRGPLGKRLAAYNRWSERQPETYAKVLDLRREVLAHRLLRRHPSSLKPTSNEAWSRILDELDANARLCKLEAAYFAPLVGSKVALSELQASLPRRTAYIGWLETEMGREGEVYARWAYVIKKTGPIIWIPTATRSSRSTPDYGELADRYCGLMRIASTWALRMGEDSELVRLQRELYRLDLDPVLPQLEGIEHLVVEFAGEYNAWMPLEVFLDADGTYAGDRFTISYSPSADAFVTARNEHRDRADGGGRVVAVGDIPIAVPSTSENRLGSVASDVLQRSAITAVQHRAAINGDINALDGLPRLPFAGVEITNLSHLYPNLTVLENAEASEANVLSLFSDGASFRIIHFATHALSETLVRHRSSLVLSRAGTDGSPSNDGLLDALEIELTSHLDADLVTLSGCQTASGSGWYPGEPLGLATVFLGVGVESVIASMWKVDDWATALLMNRFYENLSGVYPRGDGRDGRPMSKALALAEAKRWTREFRDESGQRPFAHPIYWSGFILIGSPD